MITGTKVMRIFRLVFEIESLLMSLVEVFFGSYRDAH